MIKLLTIIGARPQIIKAAALSRAIREHFSDSLMEIIVHTGQHYDENMSEVFFRELNIPTPDYNLEVGSGLHGEQSARMISGIEQVLLKEKPDYIVLYGDTNSTLAGSIAASKLLVPVIHIEAGLRSFNKSMPEELNRIICDHCSTLLFSPTLTGIKNLQREGFSYNDQAPYSFDHPGVFHCGDIMYDNSLYFKQIANSTSSILDKLGLKGKAYILCTIHRNNNTDDPQRLQALLDTIIEISTLYDIHIVLPFHPRSLKMAEKLDDQSWKSQALIHILPPASFLDMIQLEAHCSLVMTDSGGVQKEAYFFEKPCVILRSETEWVEITESGSAILADANPSKIKAAVKHFMETRSNSYPSVFGDGKAAISICQKIIQSHEK